MQQMLAGNVVCGDPELGVVTIYDIEEAFVVISFALSIGSIRAGHDCVGQGRSRLCCFAGLVTVPVLEYIIGMIF